ncbi:Cox family DNA-binding protein [Aeromonas rivipollensis]|jgi:hypothetical protein|uniref:Cox family DNA-binding protein n=1 Tax=Aeromonas rivipollensis TaxID=948519 RepID=UPI000FB926AA
MRRKASTEPKNTESKKADEIPFLVGSRSDVITHELFALELGKSTTAVKDMIDDGKVPYVEMKKPGGVRAERYIYLPAWNAGMKLAFESRPKEIRDGWLTWLGLSV